MATVTDVNYIEKQWNEVKTQVVNNALLWTIYDIALKALAYVVWSLPFVGMPLAFSMLAFSFVIDAAIIKQWPDYLAGIRAFFNGEVKTFHLTAQHVQRAAKGSVWTWISWFGKSAAS
jgi:hypothetical protein